MLKQGNNRTCLSYSQVQVAYQDFITPQSRYLSTTKLTAPTSFVANISQVTCLHGAVLNMTAGERSYITCPQSEAYGALGIPYFETQTDTLMFLMDLVTCE